MIENWEADTLLVKLPNWMPGYYQIMNYADGLEKMTVVDKNGASLEIQHPTTNSWKVIGIKSNTVEISYTIQTNRQFVANSFVDKEHAYLIPSNTFLYIQEQLDLSVTVQLEFPATWDRVATGLTAVNPENYQYQAADFDTLYDCPILMGQLEELPSFEVNGIPHRFIGYRLGDFDKEAFMHSLKEIVQTSVAIIGDIPYPEYTFIGIGPGRD